MYIERSSNNDRPFHYLEKCLGRETYTKLLQKIFSYLDGHSQKNAALVSKTWKSLIPFILLSDGKLYVGEEIFTLLKKTSTIVKRCFERASKDSTALKLNFRPISSQHLKSLITLLSEKKFLDNEAMGLLDITAYLRCEDVNTKLQAQLSKTVLKASLKQENFHKVLNLYIQSKKRGFLLLNSKCLEFIQSYFKESVEFNHLEKRDDIYQKLNFITTTENCQIPLVLNLKNEKQLPVNLFEIFHFFSPYLVSLNLESPYFSLTDEEIKSLNPLINLTSLSIACKVTEEGLEPLQFLTNLTSMKLNVTPIIPKSTPLSALQYLTALTSLDLSNSEVSDEDLKTFTSLTKLIFLNLNDCQYITDKGLIHLHSLKLTSLSFGGYRLTPISYQGMSGLLPFTQLTSLNLKGSPSISAGYLEKLQPLTNLTFLNLSACRSPLFTDAGLGYLNPLTNLIALNFNRCQIEGWGFSDLHSLVDLRGLSLEETQISDYFLKNLTFFPKLSLLNLANCPYIRNTGSYNLRPFTSLTSLNLSGCNIRDEGLENLQPLVNLSSLDLSHCDLITDQGLKNLKTLIHLTFVDASNSKFISKLGLEFINNQIKFNSSNIPYSRRNFMNIFGTKPENPEENWYIPFQEEVKSGEANETSELTAVHKEKEKIETVAQDIINSSKPGVELKEKEIDNKYIAQISKNEQLKNENRQLKRELESEKESSLEKDERIEKFEEDLIIEKTNSKILEERIKILNDYNEGLKEEAKNIEASYRERIKMLEEGNESIRVKNKVRKVRIKELEEGNKNLRNENEAYKDRISKLEDGTKNLRAEYERTIGDLKEKLKAEYEGSIEGLKEKLGAEYNGRIVELKKILEGETSRFEFENNAKDATLRQKDATIIQLVAENNAKDATIARQDAIIRQRDTTIIQNTTDIGQRDIYIGERDAAIRERDIYIGERDAVIRERDITIEQQARVMGELNALIIAMQNSLDGNSAANEKYLSLTTEVNKKMVVKIDEIAKKQFLGGLTNLIDDFMMINNTSYWYEKLLMSAMLIPSSTPWITYVDLVKAVRHAITTKKDHSVAQMPGGV